MFGPCTEQFAEIESNKALGNRGLAIKVFSVIVH
jgi:hypothetical protein